MRNLIVGLLIGLSLSASAVWALNDNWFDQNQQRNQLNQMQQDQHWNEMSRQQAEQMRPYKAPC